jgi:hypothetical protein
LATPAECLVAAEAVSTKHTARKLASASAMMRMNVSLVAAVIGAESYIIINHILFKWAE